MGISTRLGQLAEVKLVLWDLRDLVDRLLKGVKSHKTIIKLLLIALILRHFPCGVL